MGHISKGCAPLDAAGAKQIAAAKKQPLNAHALCTCGCALHLHRGGQCHGVGDHPEGRPDLAKACKCKKYRAA